MGSSLPVPLSFRRPWRWRPDQAFEVLRDASRRYNRKLRDIPAGIVAATSERSS